MFDRMSRVYISVTRDIALYMYESVFELILFT